jgi:hypothetical protein
MIHPGEIRNRAPAAAEQHELERKRDSELTALDALRETGSLGPLLALAIATAVGIYFGARLVSMGDLAPGLLLAGASIVGGSLAMDTRLCVGTPTRIHECRHCRRETDRWRGESRDGRRHTSLFGQRSAASETPRARRSESSSRGDVGASPDMSADSRGVSSAK